MARGRRPARVRSLAAAGLAVLAVLASGACSSRGAHRRLPGPTSLPGVSAASGTTPAPSTVVAVTTSGTLEVLDARTATARQILARDAVGDEVALTPDGSAVYYQAVAGCFDEIRRVALTGGAPVDVAPGSHPAVSPDGNRLAFVHEPSETPQCGPADVAPSAYRVIVEDVAGGAESEYPLPPQVVSAGVPLPVDHLSWAPDGHRIAVSIHAPQDNEGWALRVLDTRVDRYYVSETPSLPVTGARAASSYWREGVFLPDGNLLVARVCCDGTPAVVVSSELLEVDSVTGAVIRDVATGLLDRDHTSLTSDRSGQALLYLSGTDLLVSVGGARPTTLASGFVAAAW